MNRQSEVFSRLRSLSSAADAATLFSSVLNYDYTGKTLSRDRFSSSLNGQINKVEIIATHGEFKIVHCDVSRLLLGIERPVIGNLLRDYPYSLFVFSDTAKQSWHFINVKYDEEESRRKLFRRIVVGPEERLHTAAQRLAMLEIPDESALSPLELQELHDSAFDVEAVTKEFFTSFATMFDLVRTQVEELNPRHKGKAEEFSQLLLDRLMFLYFVQKKGWLNNQGDYLYDRFTKNFSSQPDKHNYYTDIILRVFQKLASADLQYGELGSLPFLNGGLFEIGSWEMSIKVKNGLFARLFKDLFEHYNFTVREDTAMDMEVAIDPEMLGKVFENLVLLREKDPQIDLRKATGSYYTPRLIVDFMSKQSLKEYLIDRAYEPEGFGLRDDVLQFTDSAYERSTKQITFDAPKQDVLKKHLRAKIGKLFTLSSVRHLTDDETGWLNNSITIDEASRLKALVLNCRVCDPAVGSGAFVVGMLHVMVAIVKLLDLRLFGLDETSRRNYDYDKKKEIIERCLYGVDIQRAAVRLCELRLWLSLIVDFQADSAKIPPLPNLSYRIRRGNSLFDKILGYRVDLSVKSGTAMGGKILDLIDEIQEAKHRYFSEAHREHKDIADRHILAKQCELALIYLKARQDQLLERYQSKYSSGLFGEKKLKRGRDAIEKETFEKEIGELDRILGVVRGIAGEARAIENSRAGEKDKERQLSDTFVWRLDFAEVFKEKGGYDIVVENPPYGIEFEIAEKQILKVRYDHIAERIRNSFLYFLGMSYDLLNSGGCMSLIIPNEFLFQIYMTKARTYYVDNARILSAINVGEDVFDAIVPVCMVAVKEQAKTPQESTQLKCRT